MIDVRPCTLPDWQTLKAVRLAALKDAPDAFAVRYGDALARTDDDWKQSATPSPTLQFHLAYGGGEAVGMIGGTITPTGRFLLIGMWVAPAWRGKGVADALVAALLAGAAQAGHEQVFLSVSPLNRSAVALYERHGFAFIDEWEPLESNPAVELRAMCLHSQQCGPVVASLHRQS